MPNKKFHITTLGCKINIYESEAISAELINNGFILEKDSSKSDILIINSCTVTQKADAKSRYIIRKLKKENNESILIVCGCMVNTEKSELEKIDEIDILIDNKDKDKIAQAISSYLKSNKTEKPFFYHTNIDGTFNFKSDKITRHSRAFIKIQDGCNNFCSFCRIPYARGREKSRNENDIVEEIRKLSGDGFEEFILSGINIGSYNSGKKDLNDLLDHLTDEFTDKRFRISSIEPQHVTPDFIKIFKKKNICPHLHIPLQSGSRKILKLMNRKYSLEEFSEKIMMIRENKTDPYISSDLIIGFPDESESDFQETADYINKIKFSFIHLFGFSPRENTPAFDIEPKVPERTRVERISIIKKIIESQNLDYRNKFINKELEVIIESNKRNKDYFSGKSENYLSVLIKADDHKLVRRKRYKVILRKIDNEKNYADLIIKY